VTEVWLIQRFKNSTQDQIEFQIEPWGYPVWLEPGSMLEIHYLPPENRKDTSHFQTHDDGLIQFWCEGPRHKAYVDGEQFKA